MYFPFTVALTFNDLMRGHSKGMIVTYVKWGPFQKLKRAELLEWNMWLVLTYPHENFIITKWSTMCRQNDVCKCVNWAVCFRGLFKSHQDDAKVVFGSGSSDSACTILGSALLPSLNSSRVSLSSWFLSIWSNILATRFCGVFSSSLTAAEFWPCNYNAKSRLLCFVQMNDKK